MKDPDFKFNLVLVVCAVCLGLATTGLAQSPETGARRSTVSRARPQESDRQQGPQELVGNGSTITGPNSWSCVRPIAALRRHSMFRFWLALTAAAIAAETIFAAEVQVQTKPSATPGASQPAASP